MPAAAVIPAPIAYIKVVAVKKFVVECLGPAAVVLCHCTSGVGAHPLPVDGAGFIPRVGRGINYCEQIRVFKAGRTA